jgi:acetyl-CoA C-acetyltransferase
VLWLEAAERSSRLALERAGLSVAAIDVFELHDAYTVLAALALEASGFAPRGRGWQLARDNEIGLDGQVPISTFGGLKARGHAGGASGVYQAVEVVLQLRGEAGANQVANARVGMAQSLGGSGATAVTHVFRLDE